MKTFVRLLHEGVSEKTITVGTRAEFAVAPDQFIGFLEKGYCYFWPSRLYDFVRKSYASGGKSFPLSMNQLWEALYVAGVLVPEHRRDESGRKFEYGVRLSFGERPRMLRLDPSQFEMYL